MKPPVVLNCEFVRTLPERLDERTLYVSMEYATASHKCCCGCGNEVVTPISPTDWQLTYDGVGVSLSPSIGNWGFACQSHYWIRNGKAVWAGTMSREQIAAVRSHDRDLKERHYGSGHKTAVGQRPNGTLGKQGFWAKFFKWFGK